MVRKLATLAGIGVLAAAALTGNAGAQGAENGTCVPPIEDLAGDQRVPGAPSGNGAGAKNLDVTGLAFRMAPDKTGKPGLVAELSLADSSDKTITPGWDAHTHWIRYMVGDTQNFVISQLNADGTWVFWSGTQGSDGFLIDGNTTGRVLPNGVVQVDIKGKPKVLGMPYVDARAVKVLNGQPILAVQSDRGPDSGGGEDVEFALCPGAAVASPTPGPGTTPGVTGLDVTAGKVKRKGKTLSVALTGTATKLTAALKKGKKSVAKGKLSTLTGQGTLKLKGKKALKRGSYALALKGVTAAGESATKTLKLKVK